MITIKIKFRCFYFLSLYLCAFVSLSQAAFKMQPQSVKAVSLGKAFMANGNESSVVFMNPAGIADIGSSELSFIYAKPFAGLGDINLGLGCLAFTVPSKIGNFGAGVGTFVAADLKQERTIVLGYAKSLTVFDRELNIGISGKHFYHNYMIGSDPMATRDPIFAKGTSKSAIGLDAGLTFSISRPLKLGVAVRNINQPNIGLMTSDKLARELQAGIALDIPNIGLMVNSDLFYRAPELKNSKNDILSLIGLEKGLYSDKVMLRLGGNKLEYAGGVGIRLGNFRFDYAVVLNRNLKDDNAGTHQVGVSFKLGR